MSRFLAAVTIGAAAMTGVVSGQSFEQEEHGKILRGTTKESSDMLIQESIDHALKAAEGCQWAGNKVASCPGESTTCVAVHYGMKEYVGQPIVTGLCLPKERGTRRLCVKDSFKEGEPVATGAQEVPYCLENEVCALGDLTSPFGGTFYECKSTLPTDPTAEKMEKMVEEMKKMEEVVDKMKMWKHAEQKRMHAMHEQTKEIKKEMKDFKQAMDVRMKTIDGNIQELMNNSENKKLIAKSGKNEV